MNLLAISDLHLGHRANRRALESIQRRPKDWLILAGDIGETEAELADAFSLLKRRFARVIWVPGNHELWATDNAPGSPQATRGEARYAALVALARSFGVVTPEDPYPIWPGSDQPIVVAPLFTLYDYSFRPDEIAGSDVIEWAAADGIISADENSARSRAAPEPGRMVRGAGEENSRPPRGASRRLCNGFSQSLPPGACACFAPAHASFRSVVRHATDRRVAFPFPCRRSGLWSPPRTAQLRTRQSTVPRGVAGLSGAMGSAFRDRHLSTRHPVTHPSRVFNHLRR